VFIELIDAIRCPADHAPSSLVAAFEAITERDVISGMLGCPVCRSEFQIRQGDLWLVTTARPSPAARPLNPEEDALRLAASLDLRTETGFAILRGAWCALADRIVELSPTHLVLLDPPLNTARGPGRSIIHAGGTVPFSPATAIAATIDDDERAYGLSLAVKPKGRLVGPNNIKLPRDTKELARDDRWWVAEKENATVLVQLGVRGEG
jgi:uncharacterized protein YbaR (Trm112 family)